MPNVFLQLAPEMGGVRFGPFQSRIQIGSDRVRNQLVLDPAHGIFPVHALVLETGPGLFTVAPVEAGCAVFLVPQGQAQMWPVQAPVQARTGDFVIFGNPAGPRFQLQGAVAASTHVAVAPSSGRGGPATSGMTGYGGRVANEVSRQGQARLLTKTPFREVYMFWTRFSTGALTNPRVLVAAGTTVVTVLLGGGATCSGLALAVWHAVTR